MCTCVSFRTKDHYFGRNLDLEYRYQETVVITPRRFPFSFRHAAMCDPHYAMIGTATIVQNVPLYYEATNEKGLSAAALNFPGYAHYSTPSGSARDVAPFELIPFLLGQCSNIGDALSQLERIRLAAIPFSDDFPLSPLHFMISDREKTIVLEPLQHGLQIHDNPVHVLTNSPPFDMQMMNLTQYMHLSPADPVNTLLPEAELHPFSRGMGAIGLPGDWSSCSRFVRAAYLRAHALCEETESESVAQLFHILRGVSMPRGSVMVGGKPELTLYTSCCNTDKGVYYYTTYENSRINAIDMHQEDLNRSDLILYPLDAPQDILNRS